MINCMLVLGMTLSLCIVNILHVYIHTILYKIPLITVLYITFPKKNSAHCSQTIFFLKKFCLFAKSDDIHKIIQGNFRDSKLSL